MFLEKAAERPEKTVCCWSSKRRTRAKTFCSHQGAFTLLVLFGRFAKSICPSIHLSVLFYLSILPSVHLSLLPTSFPSLLFVHPLSVHPFVPHPSVHLYIHPPIRPSIRPFIHAMLTCLCCEAKITIVTGKTQRFLAWAHLFTSQLSLVVLLFHTVERHSPCRRERFWGSPWQQWGWW